MSDQNFQLASDPAGMEQVAKLQAEFNGKMVSANIEMHNGRTYSGFVSGMYFGERSGSNLPRRVGGYILIDVDGVRFRLDAVDIKAWSAVPV